MAGVFGMAGRLWQSGEEKQKELAQAFSLFRVFRVLGLCLPVKFGSVNSSSPATPLARSHSSFSSLS